MEQNWHFLTRGTNLGPRTKLMHLKVAMTSVTCSDTCAFADILFDVIQDQ